MATPINKMKQLLSMSFFGPRWGLSIGLILVIQIETAAATPGLFDLGKEQVKEFGASGSITEETDGSIRVEISIEKTSKLRRGELYVHVPSPGGTMTSTWTVDPSRPLMVKFSIPKGKAIECTVIFSVSRSEDSDLEAFTAGYMIGLSGPRSPIFGTIPKIKKAKGHGQN